MSPSWQRVLGWSPQELLDARLVEFVHPGDRQATLLAMERVAAATDTVSFRNRCRCQDGSWKWLEWSVRMLPGGREVCAIARDVTLLGDLESEMLRLVDQARERMGRDLHDGLGPHLAAIRQVAGSLADALQRHGQPEASRAGLLRGLAIEAVSLFRDLAHGIFPLRLESGDLSRAFVNGSVLDSVIFGLC